MTFVSFLRLQLQPSTVSRGLAYELLVLKVLKNYSFQLTHTGRSGDRGQDFFGHWLLPDRRVQVIGECSICEYSIIINGTASKVRGGIAIPYVFNSFCPPSG